MQKRHTKILKSDGVKQIEHTIAEIEKKTSGEIVVAVVPKSSDYLWVHTLWACLGWAGSSVVLWGIGWPLSLSHVIEIQLLGIIGATLFSLIPLVKRFTIPAAVSRDRVHSECLANFVSRGVHQTHQRTGILVFLSEFEKRVNILADVGIHAKIPDGFWDKQLETIVEGIRRRKAADGICKALEAMAAELAERFPPDPNNPNELSNHVQT